MPIFTRPAPFPKMDGSQPCRRDPDLWTPDQPAGPEAREAAGICRAECPFLQACFDYAITHVVDGVYGGMTAPERQTYRRGNKIYVVTEAKEAAESEATPVKRTRVSVDDPACGRGHLRTPENAYRGSKGGWECRPCRAERSRKHSSSATGRAWQAAQKQRKADAKAARLQAQQAQVRAQMRVLVSA